MLFYNIFLTVLNFKNMSKMHKWRVCRGKKVPREESEKSARKDELLCGVVAELFESFDYFLRIGFSGVVFDGDSLVGERSFNFLDAFNKADVTFDAIFTAFAVHRGFSIEFEDNSGVRSG